MSAAEARSLHFDDYLAAEAVAAVKHGLVGGQVFAMVGTTKRHNEIAGLIFEAVRAPARAQGCFAYMSDVMLRVGDAAYYPDVMVTCQPTADDRYETDPCLIVEVLSPSTQLVDRREKAGAYRSIASLRAYLIVDPYLPNITAHELVDGEWAVRTYSNGGSIMLTCPDVIIDIDALYAGLD